MEEFFYYLISIILTVGFLSLVFGLFLLGVKRDKRKVEALHEQFEQLFPMFKLYFNKVGGENRVFSSAPLLILKRRVIDWAIALFFCITFILMALFFNGGERKLLLVLNAVLVLLLIIRSSSFVRIYENGLVYGHFLKKKTIWFDTVDSITARLYDHSPRKSHIDATADYSNVCRAYVLRRDGKFVFEINETRFTKARAIETCFDINSPVIKEIIHSSI